MGVSRGQIPGYCQKSSDLPYQPRPLNPPSEAPLLVLHPATRLLNKDAPKFLTHELKVEVFKMLNIVWNDGPYIPLKSLILIKIKSKNPKHKAHLADHIGLCEAII